MAPSRPDKRAAKRPPPPRRAAARAKRAKARGELRGTVGRRPLWRRLLRPRVLITAGLIAFVLAAAYQLWIRDLSLFAIDNVTVSGVGETVGGEEIEAALTTAAGGMTTLHIDDDALAAAVSGFPAVAGIDVAGDFPHGATIAVRTRRPVVLVRDRETRELTQVAADGTILATVPEPDGELPIVGVGTVPASGRLTGESLAVAQITGATPLELRELVDSVRWDASGDGVEVTLDGGIPVRFGSGSRASAKWAAASAILADPAVVALTYLDVTVPERPALGGNA